MEIIPGVPEEITDDELVRLEHKIAARAGFKTPVKMVSGEEVVVGDLLSGTWVITGDPYNDYVSGPHFVLELGGPTRFYDFTATLLSVDRGRVVKGQFRRDAYFELLSSEGEEVPL